MFKLFNKNKKEPENLKEVMEYLEKLERNYENISRELKEFKAKSKKDLQKIGIVRFSPFAEVGGDQSFSVAILDENNDGFILTSHYLREFNRVYAKPVENGVSKYQLSKEELEAINKAINA